MTSKSDAECEAAIKEFASITQRDEAFAHSILQDVDYNLEEGIMRYYSEMDSGPLPDAIVNELRENGFEPSAELTSQISNDGGLDLGQGTSGSKNSSQGTSKSGQSNKPTKDESPNTPFKTLKRPLDEDDKSCRSKKQSRINEHFGSKLDVNVKNEAGPSSSKVVGKNLTGLPDQVTVISYNIDGIDERSLETRFMGVLNIIAKVNPEIIFLQEVVQQVEPKIHKVLGPMYNICSGFTGIFGYYTVTAISKNIRVEKNHILEYDHSQMGRNMLCVEATWQGLPIRLINTHLESCWDQARVRTAQFSKAMEKLNEYSKDPKALLIFGGDLNIRDPEVTNVPAGVQDAWIACGSSVESKYTWDTKLNDNHETKKPVRNRFDRFFVKGPYQQMDFWLAGQQRIKSVGMFPSDHFAIVCKFTHPRVVQ